MELNICFVGDSNTGKKSLIKKIKNGVFYQNDYLMGDLIIHNIYFNTNKGEIKVNICIINNIECDISYYEGSDAVFIFFDTNDNNSKKNVDEWIKKIKKNNMDDLIVILGNKVDCTEYCSKYCYIHSQNSYDSNYKYFDISTKTNYNIIKPFEYVINKLLNIQIIPKLSFVCLEKQLLNTHI